MRSGPRRILVRAAGSAAAAATRLTPLAGGVSSLAWRADAPRNGSWVIKIPRKRFRVQARWIVDVARLDVEVRFAKLIEDRLGAGRVAKVVAVSRNPPAAVWEAAPRTFEPWRSRLLSGRIEPRVALHAGQLLRAIHQVGRQDPRLRRTFLSPRLLEQQRISPYFRRVAARHPHVRPELDAVTRDLWGPRPTLVHGDFSPKNILTNGRRILLIDHEVANWARPEFDAAFLLHHLLLKSVRNPKQDTRFAACATAFLQAVQLPRDPDRLGPRLLGAFALSRIDGKSPVHYLGSSQRKQVRRAAIRLLEDPPPSLSRVVRAWSDLCAR